MAKVLQSVSDGNSIYCDLSETWKRFFDPERPQCGCVQCFRAYKSMEAISSEDFFYLRRSWVIVQKIVELVKNGKPVHLEYEEKEMLHSIYCLISIYIAAFEFVNFKDGESNLSAPDFTDVMTYISAIITDSLSGFKADRNATDYGPVYCDIGESLVPLSGFIAQDYLGGEFDGIGQLQSIQVGRGGLLLESGPIVLPLINGEDVQVLLKVLETSKDFPSITVPGVWSSKSVPLNLRLRRTTPRWLLKYDVGKTLYAVDVLCGELCWNPMSFVRSGYSDENFERIAGVIDAIQVEAPTEKHHEVINIAPGKVEYDLSTSGSFKKKVVARDFEVRIRILAGYAIHNTGGALESEFLYTNDMTLGHIRRGRIIEDNFDAICAALPVFERYRQIIALFYGMKALKDAGQVLPPSHGVSVDFDPGLEYCMYLNRN